MGRNSSIKVFYDNSRWFVSPKGTLSFRVLFHILGLMPQNSCVVEFPSDVRSSMCSALGISSSSCSRALSELCSLGVLSKAISGKIIVNPHLYWNGALSLRSEAINNYGSYFK